MAQPVSVLDGEVNRNWHVFDSRGQKHLLTLFHDCVTGARAAMLDYEEVPGSAGTTNLFNLVAGRDSLPFTIKSTGESGHLSVLRRGLAGFSYECELNGRLVLDTTSVVQNTDYEYEVSIPASVDIGTRVSGVTWYEVCSKRKADGKGTLVHRRFRDFFALHEQVVSLMKGHHLRSSLPRFPEKKSKLWTNHGDMSFVEERRRALDLYLKTLLQLPHVSTLDSTRAFLGMVGNLREFSVVWEGKDLGAALKRASSVAGGKLIGGSSSAGDGLGPPVITSIQGPGKTPPGVSPGDRLFRVNGESTEFMSLEAAWNSFKRASRPVLLHFLGPIIRMDSTLAPLPEAFLRRRGIEGRSGQPPSSDDDGGPPLAAGLLRPDGTAGAESQWGLGGITQMRWPTWRRPQDGGGALEPVAGNGANDAGSASAVLGRNRSSARLPPGRTVGPFGDGAGASRSSPSFNSRLFGDVEGAECVTSGDNQARAWRSSNGTGVAGLQSTVRPLGDKQGGAGSRKSSDWMPDMTIGAGSSGSNTSAASAAAALRWEAPSQPSSAGSTLTSATGRRPDGPPKWLTDAGGSSTLDLTGDANFGSGTSAMPQDRLNTQTSSLFEDNGVGRSGVSEERVGERYHSSGGKLAEGSMGRPENGKAGHGFVPSSFGGYRDSFTATGRPAAFAFGDAVAVDDEKDEDNPFA